MLCLLYDSETDLLDCKTLSLLLILLPLFSMTHSAHENRQRQRFVSSIQQLLQEVDRCRSSPLDRETADFLLFRLGGAVRYKQQVLSFVERSGQFSPTEGNDLRNFARDIRVIEQLFQELPVFSLSLCYRAPVRHTGSVGRPAYEISRGQLMILQSCFFSWSTIVSILGVSRWTIHRSVNELEIPHSLVTYSQIPDIDLQQIVREELVSMPRCGERYMQQRNNNKAATVLSLLRKLIVMTCVLCVTDGAQAETKDRCYLYH